MKQPADEPIEVVQNAAEPTAVEVENSPTPDAKGSASGLLDEADLDFAERRDDHAFSSTNTPFPFVKTRQSWTVRDLPRRLWKRGRTHLRNRGRIGFLRTCAALQQWHGADNPFLGRAWHVETRSGRPWKLALVVNCWLLLGIFGVWFAWALADPQGAAQFWGKETLPSKLLAFLGDNFIGYAALMTADVCAFGALLVARLRVGAMLRREQLQGTLEQLQLLPLPGERWLWLAGAPGVFLALFVAAMGLPVFALAIWTSQWSPLDLCGLFLVFLWLGHAAPLPLVAPTSSASSRTTRSPSPTESAVMAVLNKEVSEIQTLTQAAPLETSPAQSSTRKAALFDSTNQKTSTSSSTPRTARGAQSETVVMWFLGIGLMQGALWMLRFWIASSGGSNAALYALGWPESVVSLMAGLPLTWPLVLARLLVTPLPFFALSLPPALLLVPWSVGRRRCSYLHLANSVDKAFEAVQKRRKERARKLNRPLNWLLWTMLIGYGWRPLIALVVPLLLRGAPSVMPTLNTPTPTIPAWTQSALWTAILIFCTLRAWSEIAAVFRAEKKPDDDRAKESSTRLAVEEHSTESSLSEKRSRAMAGRWRKALLAMVRNLGVGVALYFLACWLGGMRGTDAMWCARLLPTGATTLAFLVAVCGVEVLGAALPKPPLPARARWRGFVALWFYGLALEVVARHLFAQLDTSAPFGHFEFEQAPHVVLSPLVSLLSLLRFQLSRPNNWWLSWWMAPLLQAIVGVACASISVPLSRRKVEDEAVGVSWWRRFWRWFWRCAGIVARGVWFVVVLVGKPIYRVLDILMRGTLGRVLSFIERHVNRLIDWGEAQRNPVLDFALYRSLTTSKSSTQNTKKTAPIAKVEYADIATKEGQKSRTAVLRSSLTMLCFGALALEIMIFGAVSVSNGTMLLSPWTQNNGWPINADWQAWGHVLTLVTLTVASLVFLVGTSNLGNALDLDRKNGTLVFLFLTPLSDDELLRGKASFFGLTLLPTLTTFVPWLLLGIIMACAGGDWTLLPVGFLAALEISTFGLYCLCRQTCGAASALKTGTGSATAFSRILVIEALLFAVLVLGWNLGWLALCVALILVSVCHIVLARLAWRKALQALHRQRYSDEATRGTVAN